MFNNSRLVLALGILSSFLPAAICQSVEPLEAVVITDLGEFRFEFLPNAPKHVEQFQKLARQGYYDGSAFHRVFLNGLIQGGDPLLKDPKTPRNLWGTGGLNLLASEVSAVKHERGIVSTVRLPDKPNSDGSQFFVCVTAQTPLDGQYSAFGKVTEGMDVVEKISQQPADGNNVLQQLVRIRKVTIEKRREEPFASATVDQLKRTVTMKTTLGTVKIAMQPDWAPETVRNFLKLAQSGWLNGTQFHRLSKQFVLQGGMGYTRQPNPAHYADRWVHPIKGEFQKDVKHVRGIISMAHGTDPNSADTSFFLMLGPAENLDGQFAAFGKIVEGLDVLDAFEKEEVDGETPKRRLEVIEVMVD